MEEARRQRCCCVVIVQGEAEDETPPRINRIGHDLHRQCRQGQDFNGCRSRIGIAVTKFVIRHACRNINDKRTRTGRRDFDAVVGRIDGTALASVRREAGHRAIGDTDVTRDEILDHLAPLDRDVERLVREIIARRIDHRRRADRVGDNGETAIIHGLNERRITRHRICRGP